MPPSKTAPKGSQKATTSSNVSRSRSPIGRACSSANRSEISPSDRDPSQRSSQQQEPIIDDENDTFSAGDIQDIIRHAISSQMPSLIIETSKVVKELVEADRSEQSKSVNQDLRLIRQKQLDLETASKAVFIKSEGYI